MRKQVQGFVSLFSAGFAHQTPPQEKPNVMNEALAQSGLYQPIANDQSVAFGQREPKWLSRQAQHEQALEAMKRANAVQRLQSPSRQPIVQRLRQAVFRA